VAPFGIKVTCVYPGRFRTDFLDGSSVRYGNLSIEDYASTSAQHRQALDGANHQQIGDPKKFAAAMLAVVGAERPPVWLATGSDAFAVFDNKSHALTKNIEQWKELVLSTDF
jgi:NAD(P)-dependent dehydrogenase (short-subunit alcohol dehydrogenase family)